MHQFLCVLLGLLVLSAVLGVAGVVFYWVGRGVAYLTDASADRFDCVGMGVFTTLLFAILVGFSVVIGFAICGR